MPRSANTLIEQRLGLSIAHQLRLDPERVLREISGDGDLDTFLDQLATKDETAPVWQAVIRAFAIGETYFFRDYPHFRLLRDRILPALIVERRQRGQRYLNLWSVGCATGEEAYSMAILLHELLPDRADWKVRLIATDLNATALENARRAVYRPWSFRQSEAASAIQHYFDPVEGGVQLKSFIREMVSFRQMNLLKGPPLPQLDVILCRNVLLYFADARTVEIEAMLHEALMPGGWLLLGRAESLRQRRDGWITQLFPDAPAYQKSAGRTISGRLPDLREFPEYRVETPITEAPTKPTLGTAEPQPTATNGQRAVYDAALHARQSANYAESERLLLGLLRDNDQDAAAHTLLACTYADQKRLKEAHAQLDRALTLDPLLADGYYLRGLLYLEEARTDDARRALQAALYCQRNHPLAAFTLGTVLARGGQYPRALKFWENARRAIVSLKPESPLSDMSDVTAGRLELLIAEQLAAWQ